MARRPPVIVNARFLSKRPTGVTRVGCELLRAIAAELDESGAEHRLAVASAGPANHADLRGCTVRLALPGKLGEQLLPLMYPGATILNFCNSAPLFARRAVLWIHDAHVFDSPESYPWLYRTWHRSILTTARLRRFDVVTVSHFSRERLLHCGVDPARLRVIHSGGDHILREVPDDSAIRAAGLESQQFLLVVGSPARHKNVPFAVDALLAHTADRLRIAVAGLSQEGLYAPASAVPRHPRVVMLPQISDGQLRALYAAASAVIVPSLVEGFGLYAAEALFADSGPLVLSNRAALPEVGGDAAIYFEPTDAAAIGRAVAEALQPNTASRLRAAAQRQREKFRWRRAAQQVIENFVR